MSGQSIQDRMMAAKHSIAGSGLAKSVCKATTEEVMGPKKKHLDYLIQCTHEPNVSIPQMANLLIERTQNANWVVVFKGLITIHNVMNYGNERFTQYLASNNCTLNLGAFLDKSGVQGYEMSTYIRRYAKYINEKAYAYRQMAFDFCKVKRGKEDGLLRTMSAEKLLKTVPTLQQQLDALLEFDVTPNELTNGVINAAFMLLFKDLIRLFACYNDGIINLLEKFFEMPKKQAKDALDLYKKFLVRMERCAETLKVAESVGIDKGDIPDLATTLNNNVHGAPSSLLEALEEHLKSLEGQKKTKADKSKPVVAAAITQLQSPSSPTTSNNVSETEKKKILEEEQRQLDKLKEQKLKQENQQVKPVVAAAAKPVAAAPAPATSSPGTLIGASPPAATQAIKPSDDLLGLDADSSSSFTPGGNLAEVLKTAPAGPMAPAANPFGGAGAMPLATGPQPWGAPGGLGMSPTVTPMGGPTSTLPQMGGMMPGMATHQPSMNNSMTMSNSFSSGFDSFGEILKPQSNSTQPSQTTNTTAANNPKLISSDIDSSLASLAGNLSVNGPAANRSAPSWNPPTGDKKLTGGTNWQGQAMVSSTIPGMNPYMQPSAGVPQQYYGQVPPMHMNGSPGWGMPQGQQPMGMGMAAPRPAAMGMQQPAMFTQPPMQPGMYGQPRPTNPSSDPFGAL